MEKHKVFISRYHADEEEVSKFIEYFCDEKGVFTKKIVGDDYDTTINSEDPDYIIYSGFGNDHLKYDCIRIFFTGECITPDFNECDYAIGFDRLTFGDRYARIPLYNILQSLLSR